MPNNDLVFNDETIAKLFGHEAAEDEQPSRLRDYYFKGAVYQRVTADLPLRILVGHKGIGKSALFQVARLEDEENGTLTVFLRPDDVSHIDTETADILSAIRLWKAGLRGKIVEKAVERFEGKVADKAGSWTASGMSIVSALKTFLSPMLNGLVDIPSSARSLAESFLKSKKVRIYIDDLDRGWNATQASIHRLSSLLNAMRDISREDEGVQFRVSLRSDVYYLVRTSDESTDKIEGSVVWHSWTNHEILALLIKRVKAFRGEDVSENSLIAMRQPQLASHLDAIMEPRFLGEGVWSSIPTYRMLMSVIRQRPRDLVKLCTLAAQKAYERGARQIGTNDFKPVFDQYSQGRLNDTVVEFRSELPNIDRLLLNLRTTRARFKEGKKPFFYKTAEILSRVDDIQQSHGPFVFFNGRRASNKDLVAFLYKIGFLTARKDVGQVIDRRYFEESRYLSSSFADFGFDWEVHPAFRWALKPEGIQDFFDAIESNDNG